MAQHVKSTWMSRLSESYIDLAQAVEGTTSFSFKEVTLPTCHAATAKEWRKTLAANKNLTDKYRQEKHRSAEQKQRIGEYQERFTAMMFEHSQYRQTIITLERENKEMKAAFETVVNNCAKFVDGSNHLVTPDETPHLDVTVSNASSALLSEEIDSRRTSIFSNIEDSNGTVNATPSSEINETEMPPPELTTTTHDISENESDEDLTDSDEDLSFALNLRKSMAVVGKTKMSRKTMRKTIQKGGSVSRQSNVKPQSRRTSQRLSQQTENENDKNDDISINEPTLNASDCSINITQRKSKLRRSTRHTLEPNITRTNDNSTIVDDSILDQSTVLADISSPVVQKVRKKRGRKTKNQLEAEDKENLGTPTKQPEPPSEITLTNTGRPSRRARKQVNYLEDDGKSKLRRGDKMSDSSLYGSFSPRTKRKKDDDSP